MTTIYTPITLAGGAFHTTDPHRVEPHYRCVTGVHDATKWMGFRVLVLHRKPRKDPHNE